MPILSCPTCLKLLLIESFIDFYVVRYRIMSASASSKLSMKDEAPKLRSLVQGVTWSYHAYMLLTALKNILHIRFTLISILH